ncbi:MAG: succinate dehydrogenase, hydrophobic membrane anchor protein [Steroidobacteraceae bacterium]
MSLRSPLGRVLGRGSAHEGVEHWWAQRLTAAALVILGIWFLVSLLTLRVYDHASVVAWMGGGWTTVMLILLVLVAAWHSLLGVRVVIEDYVHTAGTKTAALVLITFVHVLLAAAGAIAVLRVAFGSVG